MPKGTARSSGSIGELISHFNGVRLRIVGVGSLKMTFHSLDDIRSQNLVDIPMAQSTNIQPFRLANFIEQRASLEIGTESINDYFRINRIIIYSRSFATMHPA